MTAQDWIICFMVSIPFSAFALLFISYNGDLLGVITASAGGAIVGSVLTHRIRDRDGQ